MNVKYQMGRHYLSVTMETLHYEYQIILFTNIDRSDFRRAPDIRVHIPIGSCSRPALIQSLAGSECSDYVI